MADNKSKLSQQLEEVYEWVKRVVTQPRSELTRWQKAARFAYDLSRYGARQLRDDNAPQMAAALTFRTLFALFPIIVVSTVLFQGLRGVDRFHELVADVVQVAGLDDVHVVPLEDSPAAEDHEPVTLGEWVQNFVAQIGDINLETLGWIGLLVLIYAAIAMMATIEDVFNVIFRAPEGRSWLRRVPIYWTVLTVSPIAVGLIFFLDARVDEWIMALGGFGQWAAWLAGGLWSFTIIWLVLLGLYVLIPNTSVSWRSALVGAFVAAILLQAGKSFIGGYIANFLTTRQLYGAIGLVPLFMFWLYVMWLFVLFGLEVSATLQNLGGRRIEEMDQKRQRSGLMDPASILLVMEVIGLRFNEGKSATLRHIAEVTSIAEATIADMVSRLHEAGLVHRVERESGAVTLACPPENISADRLIEVGFAMADDSPGRRKSDIVRRLRDAQRDLAANATLATMLTSPHVDGAAVATAGSDMAGDRV